MQVDDDRIEHTGLDSEASQCKGVNDRASFPTTSVARLTL
jgi:hypothetical protein